MTDLPRNAYPYLLLAFGSVLWVTPFFLTRIKGQVPVRIDKRARVGVLLQCLAYSILWQSQFWEKPPEHWRTIVALCLFILACLISWTAERSLGSQFRFDAAVDSAHKLVRSGPYRVVRHPIYTSMFCVLLATGIVVSPLKLLLASIAVFIVGSFIRMRIEDKVLEAQFGAEFVEYQKRVAGFLPFIR
jgi:protein-S-isoprenylcysteine O-methyltransferase Ste14